MECLSFIRQVGTIVQLANKYVMTSVKTGSSSRTSESVTGAAATVSNSIEYHQHHVQHFWRLLFLTESARHPRFVRSVVSPGTLLQHGDVFLRLRQVSGLLEEVVGKVERIG